METVPGEARNSLQYPYALVIAPLGLASPRSLYSAVSWARGGAGVLTTATLIGGDAYAIGRQYRCALEMPADIFLVGLIPCLFAQTVAQYGRSTRASTGIHGE